MTKVFDESDCRKLVVEFQQLTSGVQDLVAKLKDKRLFGVHLYGDMKPEEHISHQHNGRRVPGWKSMRRLRKTASGDLYIYRFRSMSLLYYFDSRCDELGHRVKERLEPTYRVTGNIWFSYMLPGLEIPWHSDEAEGRLHLTLISERNAVAIELENGSQLLSNPMESFWFDPTERHRVPGQRSPRLHLIATATPIL